MLFCNIEKHCMAETEISVLHQMMILHSTNESEHVCQMQELRTPPPPVSNSVKGGNDTTCLLTSAIFVKLGFI